MFEHCFDITFPAEQLTLELESSRALQYLKDYLDGLKLSKTLPSTELQPADDLAILAWPRSMHLLTSGS